MSTQNLRDFLDRHMASAAGVAALVAAVEARATGKPLNSALAARADDLLAALGAGSVLDGMSAEEARLLVPEVRHLLTLDLGFAYPEGRAPSWNITDTRLLEETGEFARRHANAISRNVVPALDGLSARFAAPGARFLDIGVGVGGLAVALAELRPELDIVGIDVWQPSLSLARKAVDAAGLQRRIELREQGAESLTDQRAFDLAWMPVVFMQERIIPAAVARTHEALKPGAWLVTAYASVESVDPVTAALWRLRVTRWGGPAWNRGDVEKLLRDERFVDVRTLPGPPGVPVAFTAGRRASESAACP